MSNGDGNPVSHVNVYVFSEGADSAAALSSQLRSQEVEKGLSGAIGPLRPGKYLVLASELSLDGTAEPILKLWRPDPRPKRSRSDPTPRCRLRSM